MPYETDKQIKLVGLDEKKRVEVEVSLNLFNILKNDTLFIQKAENLRRIRTKRNGNSVSIIERLVFPISEFDNDLDSPHVREAYKELSKITISKMESTPLTPKL